MRKLLSLILMLSFCTLTNAETTIYKGEKANQLIKNTVILRYKDFSSLPNYVKFQQGKELPFDKLTSWLFNLNKNIKIKLIHQDKDQLGFIHYRYQQTINGIPVELSMFIVHVKNGLVYAMNGELFNKVNLKKQINLSESTALNKATNYIGATTYKWQIPTQEAQLKAEFNDKNATYYPKGKLVYINPKGKLNNPLTLTYKFNIYAQKPLSRKLIYVDAMTGKIVWEQELIHTIDVTGTGATGYSGNRTIVSDSTGVGAYRLRETGRGNGIRTFNSNNTTNYGTTDFTNGSKNWTIFSPTIDQYAVDAQWGAEMTYDYYLNVHGRNSIDNAGFRLDSYVHYDQNFSNAFWDGTRMTYGDGSNNSSPFTALDIAGHEITHGLTSNTANLNYQDESGALNESFSDIFGASIEKTARPTNSNWTMGEDLGFIIRDMSNPTSQGDPNTYFGTNWAPLGGADNGGVHTNSAIQNYWYFLLSDGGSGTNDNGNAYTVTGIGLTNASKIAFRNLTVYLTPNSQYTDARFYSIQSAVDLFGGCTPEVEATTNAWYAVGVGSIYSPVTVSNFSTPIVTSCSIPFTANFANTSVNGSSFNWTFGDGNTSTQTNPSNTYTNYGTYTVQLIADGGAACGKDTITKVAYIVIDSTLPCIVNLPTSGAAPTQTDCIGTLYDSGGAASPYGANQDAQITISPVGASTVTLTFVTFDVEPGQTGSCNYDYVEIHDGASATSPLIGTYCNNNIPTTVTSTVGSITIVFHSDPGVELQGFQIDWQCNMSNSAPIADFNVDVDTTCTGLINFTDISINGPTTWAWDFGDGNTSSQQNPSYTYVSNGLYTVQLTATNSIGSDVMVKTNLIYVNIPAAPTVVGDSICGNLTATLSATGSGILEWYANATGGSAINTGNTFTTPILTNTTTYYVQDVIQSPIQVLGKVDNTGGGNNYNNNQYEVFDVYSPMIIDSVDVYAGAAGVRTIELRDNTGTVLQTISDTVLSGKQTIYLGFNVNTGTNYQLGVSSSAAIDMYRNNAGINYPYTLNGLASITKSSAGTSPLNYYYFFYNWKVRKASCISPRTPVIAKVGLCAGIDNLSKTANIVSYVDNNDDVVLQLNHIEKGNYNLYVFNALGQLVINKKINVTASQQKELIQLSQKAKGIYYLQLTNNKMSYSNKLLR